MTQITSLADEIRGKIKDDIQIVPEAEILRLLKAFDNSKCRSLVHVRFDEDTVRTLNQLKMAAGLDVTKVVAYAVREMFARHPELKMIIKQFMQKL
jgi:hypothetical protein